MPKKSENLHPVFLQSTFGTDSLFLPVPKPEERTVLFGDCKWTQGVVPEGIVAPLIQSFGVSHARVIFGLFRFFQENLLDRQTTVNVGFSGLSKILRFGEGGKSKREVQRLLGDLATTWTRVVYPNGTIKEFRILDYITSKTKNGERKLESVSFSKGFLEMLDHVGDFKIFTLFYDVWCGLSSGLAQAIYLQFTAKVVRTTVEPFTEKSPWRKNITDLLQELDQEVPEFKSQRKQIFTRAQGKKGSVIDQLDGVPIQQKNLILHAKLEENTAKKDYNLCLWCEKIRIDAPTEKGEGATLLWWRMSGRSDEEYRSRLKANRKIGEKVFEDLELCGYPVQKNRRFLEIANKLLNLGELEELAADCKYRIMTGSGITNIGAYLHASIRNGIIEQSISERVLGIEEDEE